MKREERSRLYSNICELFSNMLLWLWQGVQFVLALFSSKICPSRQLKTRERILWGNLFVHG